MIRAPIGTTRRAGEDWHALPPAPEHRPLPWSRRAAFDPTQARLGNGAVAARAGVLREPSVETAALAQPAVGNAAVARSFAPAPQESGAPAKSPAKAVGGQAGAADAEPAAGTATKRAAGKRDQRPATGAAKESAQTAPAAGLPAGPPGKAAAITPSDAMAGLAALPPSEMVRGLAAVRRSSANGFEDMHAELATAPPTLDRPSGLPRKPAPAEAPPPAADTVAAAPLQELPAGEPVQLESQPVAAPEPLPASSIDPGELDRVPDEQPDEVAEMALRMLGQVPDTDESVNTSAGERPTVRLEKDADPSQMDQDETAQAARADAAWTGAHAAMAQDEGENDIFPTVPEETLTARFTTGKVPRTGKPLRNPLSEPEVAAAVDLAAAASWSEQTAKAQQDEAAAMQRKEDDERARRDETAAQIDQAEQAATEEQLGTQAQAKDDVAAARTAWAGELAAAEGTYAAKAKSLRVDHQSQIDQKKRDADDEAKRTLDQAEADAEAEKKKKVAEAEAKKREAKKESGGFIGWVKSKAKALINAIRSAVNAIFNALRRAVKFIIDQAKRLAVWAIEKARRAIVGLIHAFGTLLMLAADVFLGLFPKARDKAKAWIRRGVKAAEGAVNAAADALKKRVCQLLDALGAALDFILELYQRAYNAVLDVVEFFVVGLLEIIEGIGRLASSASMVGDHFIGQVEEEGIGVDLTKPLAIEKPEGEPDLAMAAQTAVATGTLSSSDAALYSRSSLNNTDVAVEPVTRMSLDPALLAHVLPLAAGGDYHFGQNEEPQNQRDAILQGALAAQTAGELQGPAGDGPAAATAPGPAADVARMTPEEQLAYLDAQETPHTCEAKKSEEPAKEEALPAHMRVYGRFTPGQRFSYMWGQIKKGISQWWSCNWGKVVAVLAVGALIALLLGVLTGGAIFAAIPPLMEIIGTLLVGVALARAASYIGDYLSLAWKGDLTGGAKALARGFALLIIELVFALLFNAGAVIKALKSGLKGTVKAATGAVKGALKTTVKAVGELGHAAAGAFKAGVKNSKLIMAGFRQGFGEGVRTIGQLTRDLLRKVHFRGFFFRLRGRVLQLWGRFNAEVLLGEQVITQEDAERALKAIAQAGEKLGPEARAEAEALAKAVAKSVQEEAGQMSKTLRERVRGFFNSFKSQHVKDNPVLAEVWKRSVDRLKTSASYAKYFDEAGELVKGVPPAAMKEMYAAARGNMNRALEEVVDELETAFKTQLTNRLAKLPENVQVHHLLYKSIEPELALAHSNLVLALRKTGGAADELHDLFHLVSAAGQGNRWRKLNDEIAGIVRDLYQL